MADGKEDSEAQAKLKKEMYKRMREMQVEQEKKATVKRFMSPSAYERLMNVRVANFELYSQLLDLLISLARSNRITGAISESQLKELLSKLTFRPESRIEFKHK